MTFKKLDSNRGFHCTYYDDYVATECGRSALYVSESFGDITREHGSSTWDGVARCEEHSEQPPIAPSPEGICPSPTSRANDAMAELFGAFSNAIDRAADADLSKWRDVLAGAADRLLAELFADEGGEGLWIRGSERLPTPQEVDETLGSTATREEMDRRRKALAGQFRKPYKKPEIRELDELEVKRILR